MTPELKKEIIIGCVAAMSTGVFAGIPGLALFWWTWRRDQERLLVQKLLWYANRFDGKEVLLKGADGLPSFGIVIRNRSLFPVHVDGVGFNIDGEIIELENPLFPTKMKSNPDPYSNRPMVLDEEFDPRLIPSGGSIQIRFPAAGDREKLRAALEAASKRRGVSMEKLVNSDARVIALVALETGRVFTSLPLSSRIWRRVVAIKKEMDGQLTPEDDEGKRSY